jgi:PAS domain S-box-containing protein
MERQSATDREGIWTIDAEGKTLFASEAMAAILCTTVADLIGKSSFEYVFPDDAARARSLFEGKKRGDMSAFSFRLRRSDGAPVWVTAQGTPMHDPDGNFRGVIGTFRPRGA